MASGSTRQHIKDAWDAVHVVLREVLPDSRRTLHLILLVTVPPLVVVSAPLTVVLLLIPDPGAVLTAVLSCSLGTSAVAAVTVRRRSRASRRTSLLSAGSPPVGVPEQQGGGLDGEEATTETPG
ncbi:hypothetical protein [Streptomyces abikoensis]|uniref:hypothetical protein n=1 Tax=Streptomyces abikoensis TaxID=97398 RepID=UPI00167B359C|nr:hypothetical protein [Streptomyces abikoensis]GGP77276.1 hypothetical protein GCM10010214_60790 [Streptomyces abikoensis]